MTLKYENPWLREVYISLTIHHNVVSDDVCFGSADRRGYPAQPDTGSCETRGGAVGSLRPGRCHSRGLGCAIG
jgi:hypothetical protein